MSGALHHSWRHDLARRQLWCPATARRARLCAARSAGTLGSHRACVCSSPSRRTCQVLPEPFGCHQLVMELRGWCLRSPSGSATSATHRSRHVVVPGSVRAWAAPRLAPNLKHPRIGESDRRVSASSLPDVRLGKSTRVMLVSDPSGLTPRDPGRTIRIFPSNRVTIGTATAPSLPASACTCASVEPHRQRHHPGAAAAKSFSAHCPARCSKCVGERFTLCL
jgi:hypothetical protein